jgi:hypothetical protein
VPYLASPGRLQVTMATQISGATGYECQAHQDEGNRRRLNSLPSHRIDRNRSSWRR